MSITIQYKNREHDMRILFILILTYNIYFACTINEVLEFLKYYPVRATTIAVPNNYVISITNLGNELNSVNKGNYQWNIDLQLCHQQFTATKFSQVKTGFILQQLRCCKREKQDFHNKTFSCTRAKIYRRKLLHYERDFLEQPTRRHKFHEMYQDIIATKQSKFREKRHNAIMKNTETNDKDIESQMWDDWSKWSTCSVTCGRGRQVRWRHCSSQNCTKGLKRAQMKSCRLKDCNKGLLEWLGLKS